MMGRYSVLSMLLLSAVFCGIIALSDAAGYHVIGGKEYYINTDIEFPLVTAVDSCNLLNLRLVSLQDQIKNKNITEYLIDNSFTGVFWTSGKRIIDTWYWTGIGRVVTYTDWRDTQPDDGDSTDISIIINSNFDFKWEDTNIEANYGYTICEE